jgi:putative phage replication protein|uniref:DNA-binding domain protein n=2 Tax=unclassified Caudoviricetes TaxID=2788787 RepID=A0A8S5PPP5_9CAUD|nr:MAG TPA: DNA-binding domain protein [Siphoviridae sp. ctdoa10]DAE08826.1 MAG TPA: DNA-binding domain protein [Siphoviridae sp. ctAiL5]
MYISLLTALTFAGAREDLSRVEIDTLTALSTWSGVSQIDAEVARIAARAHYSEDATKKALASLENKGLIVREARFSGGERLTSIIYVDWRSALTEECRSDYDRIADAGDGARNFPSSRENNPHLWGDEPLERAPEATKKVTKTIRSTQIPEDWRPSEKDLARTRERYPSMPIDIEIEKFRDYHLSKGTKRSNWDASWRTWCTNGNSYADGAWAAEASVSAPTTGNLASVINPNTGKPVTRDDFGYACIATGIDPNLYINYWKPYMGLPADPAWPEWAAKIDRFCGRA